MNGTLSLLLLFGAMTSPGDTLVDVQRGDRLVIRNLSGAVYVETWGQSVVRAESDEKEAIAFRTVRSGSRLELRLEEGRDSGAGDQIRVTVPEWLDLEIIGKELEAEVRDLDGDLIVRNSRGDLVFQNLNGAVEAYTVEGSIDAFGLTGSARLRTGDDDLYVVNSSAAMELETVEGEIVLDGIDAHRVSAKTTEGEIEFSGRIQEGGEYEFYSHSGDIQLWLSPPANLTATILAYQGEFQSDFPVRASGFRSGEPLAFTIGTGGARLVMETFDGEIRLLRGSEGRIQELDGKDKL